MNRLSLGKETCKCPAAYFQNFGRGSQKTVLPHLDVALWCFCKMIPPPQLPLPLPNRHTTEQ